MPLAPLQTGQAAAAAFRWQRQRSAEEEAAAEEEEEAQEQEQANDGIYIYWWQSIDGLMRLVLKPSLSNLRIHRPFNFSAFTLCPFVLCTSPPASCCPAELNQGEQALVSMAFYRSNPALSVIVSCFCYLERF